MSAALVYVAAGSFASACSQPWVLAARGARFHCARYAPCGIEKMGPRDKEKRKKAKVRNRGRAVARVKKEIVFDIIGGKQKNDDLSRRYECPRRLAAMG